MGCGKPRVVVMMMLVKHATTILISTALPARVTMNSMMRETENEGGDIPLLLDVVVFLPVAVVAIIIITH